MGGGNGSRSPYLTPSPPTAVGVIRESLRDQRSPFCH